jgi:hypothetical protein
MLPTAQYQEIVLQTLISPEILDYDNDGSIHYNLTIQKQAGINELPTVLQIKPPQGYDMIASIDGWEFNHETGFWIWSGSLPWTYTFELVFVPPGN